MAAQPTERPIARPASRRAAPGDYTARHLSVLEGLEAVRKRPGMYIGSTDSRGLMHCLWEIIDNSVDEALAGHCDRIEVVLHADGSVEVRDDGRGIPVDVEPKTGLSGVEVVFTKLHAGGKFGGGSYAASGGLHGVGASVVNALSARLDVEVDRGGKTHAMSFHRGEPGVFADPRAGTRRTPVHAVRRAVRAARRRPGQEGRHRHAGALLGRPADLPQGRRLQLRRAGHAGPADGVPRARPDPRGPRRARPAGHAGRRRPARGDVLHRGGIVEFVDFLGTGRAGDRHLAAGRVGALPRDRAGARRPRAHDPDRGRARVRASTSRCAGAPATTRRCAPSSTSSRPPRAAPTSPGSRRRCSRPSSEQVELNARRLKVSGKDDRLDKEDVLAGLTAVVTVRLAEPQFEGQTKEVLGTNAVRGIVAKVVERRADRGCSPRPSVARSSRRPCCWRRSSRR